MNSALYFGTVRHERTRPVAHAFRYRVFMVWLDLDELDQVFERRWLWSTRRPSLCWFRRQDHLGPTDVPLKTSVRERVRDVLGFTPHGPVRVLTNLRTFGYLQNPVSFYYCYDDDTPVAVVAEITNTPWGERHAYVIDLRESPDVETVFRKSFHVSPFMPMDQQYAWKLGTPTSSLRVHMQNRDETGALFGASLDLQRRPISGRSLAGALLRHPFMTLKVVTAIYWNALRLYLKRCPFHPHPRKKSARISTRSSS